MAQSAEAAIREAFAEQAQACAQRGSPLTSRLCEALERVLDRSTCTGQRWRRNGTCRFMRMRASCPISTGVLPIRRLIRPLAVA